MPSHLNDTSCYMSDSNVASDKLSGVAAISEFIGEPVRRTHYLLERKMIPAGKVGAIWVASRRALKAHFDKLTGAAA